MTITRSAPLSRWLTLLVLGTAVPLLAFAVVVLYWLVGGYRVDQDRRHTDTTRALALAVDAEIRSWKAALQALAGSHELQQGRLAGFYQEAQAVAAHHQGWIFLYDPSGQQRLNTLRPFGSPLPKTDAPELWQAFFRDRRPIVTDLLVGPVVQRYIVAVAVPVMRDGHMLYALGMAFSPERLVRLLADQRFPASWITAINDGRQRVVARAPDRPDRRGQPVVPPLARAFAAQESGTIETLLSDGRVGRNAFQRLREAPWTVNVTVPVTELQAAWQRPVLAFLLLGGLAAVAAVGLAVVLARRIARPVSEAASLAAAVVQGLTPALPPSHITEVADLQHALAGGAATVRTAMQAREQAADALRLANEALEARVQERTIALTKAVKELEEVNAELHRGVEERQRAEEALRESQVRYRSLFNGMTEGFALHEIITDDAGTPVDYRFLDINPAFERLTGLKREDVLGRRLLEVLPANEPSWVEAYGRVALTGEPTRLENFSTPLNRWYEVFAYQPAPRQFAVIFTDITARKGAEEALRASEQRFRHLYESGLLGVIFWNTDGVITDANDKFLTMVGYDRTDLTTGRIDWANMTPPEYRHLDQESIKELKATGINKLPFEKEYIRKDGSRIPIIVAGAMLDEARFNGVAFVLDITERRRAQEALRNSERLYRAIGESNAYGVWVCAPDGRNIYASESFLKLVGMTQEQCSNFGWGDVLHPDDAERTISAWKECVRAGGTWDIQHRFRGVDGQWHPILARGVPVRDERGQITFWAGINLDISRLKQAEEALQHAKGELEQRVQERTAELSRTFQQLSVQSEQLRSLASELTLVEQRERLRLAEQIHDGLQQLLVAARFRVSQVGRGEAPAVRHDCQEIGQLLDQALADSRSLTAELSPPILRTGGLLAGLEWLARWSAEKHSLTVHVQAPATPLPPLPEDLTVLLFQSVRELLFNAVKYAQVPEANVTLAWEASGLTLSVADAGAGFAPHGLRGEGGGGGGFGLARIRHRLELLGGCMTLDSAPGQGTRVTLAVLLPPADQPVATPAPAQPVASPQPARAPDSKSPRPIRILVVDDHQVVRRALAQLLRAEADLTVVGEAGTGTAAVALARQLVPDVVLMDINMPAMNGIEATRAIHGAFPAMRVIGLSMFDRGDQQAAMQAAGAVAYVSKSGPAEELLAAIRAAAS